jgi:hypothetical protein
MLNSLAMGTLRTRLRGSISLGDQNANWAVGWRYPQASQDQDRPRVCRIVIIVDRFEDLATRR